MTQRKIPSEGTIFLVPLEDRGFALGLLIRADGKGRAYGEFYGPRVEQVSTLSALKIEFDRPLLKCRFGDHGLYERRWPVVGKHHNWKRNHSHLLQFYRPHANKGFCYVTSYDDDFNLVAENVRPIQSSEDLPIDEQLGSRVVEKKLTKILSEYENSENLNIR